MLEFCLLRKLRRDRPEPLIARRCIREVQGNETPKTRQVSRYMSVVRAEALRMYTAQTLLGHSLKNWIWIYPERRAVQGYVKYYNNVRLNSALATSRRRTCWPGGSKRCMPSGTASWRRLHGNGRVAASKPREVQEGPGCATPAACDWSGVISPCRGTRNLNFRLAKNNRSKSACTLIQRKRLNNQEVWPVIFGITGPICARAPKFNIQLEFTRILGPRGHHDWPVMPTIQDSGAWLNAAPSGTKGSRCRSLPSTTSE